MEGAHHIYDSLLVFFFFLVDLYTASRAWSSSTSFSGVHEKNGMGVEADGDLADSWKDADFRGVYRVLA